MNTIQELWSRLKDKKEFASVVFLLGIFYQILCLVTIDKVTFFSRSQVINDTVFSVFLVLLPLLSYYITFHILEQMSAIHRRVLFIIMIIITVYLGLVLVVISRFYVFIFLFLAFGVLMAITKKKNNYPNEGDTTEDHTQPNYILFIIGLSLYLICVFTLSDPYKYNQLTIKDSSVFT